MLFILQNTYKLASFPNISFKFLSFSMQLLKLRNPLFYLSLQKGFVWQTKFISSIDICILGQSELYQCILFGFAEQNAYSGFLKVQLYITVEIVEKVGPFSKFRNTVADFITDALLDGVL